MAVHFGKSRCQGFGDFEELLLFQLRAFLDRQELKMLPAPAITFEKDKIAAFVKTLPFTLTDDQRKAAFEILLASR